MTEPDELPPKLTLWQRFTQKPEPKEQTLFGFIMQLIGCAVAGLVLYWVRYHH